MQYSSIRSKLRTGDILLFSGVGVISNGIKLFTYSKWSHVGMVYRIEDPLDPQGSIFCWESTTLSNVADAESGKLTKGVQRVELSERLERAFATGYQISVRTLSKPLSNDMVLMLNNFRHEVSGREYEKNKLQLFKSAYDGLLGNNEEDLSSLFCSELIAEGYQKMGLLAGNYPSSEYVPKDFSTEKSGLSLQFDYQLSEEIMLTSL